MKNIFFFPTYLFLLFSLTTTAQIDSLSGKYHLYKNHYNRFSFMLPVEWEVVKDPAGELPDRAFHVKDLPYRVDTLIPEIFTITTVGKGVCDSAFLTRQGFGQFFDNGEGFYSWTTPNGDLYWYSRNTLTGQTDTDTLHLVKSAHHQAYWHAKGCYYTNDPHSEPVYGKCETLYFFDGKHDIICISTNGYALDEKVRQKIITSFKYF